MWEALSDREYFEELSLRGACRTDQGHEHRTALCPLRSPEKEAAKIRTENMKTIRQGDVLGLKPEYLDALEQILTYAGEKEK